MKKLFFVSGFAIAMVVFGSCSNEECVFANDEITHQEKMNDIEFLADANQKDFYML